MKHQVSFLGLVAALWIGLVQSGLCQPVPYFKQLSVKEGLSSGLVYAAYQDQQGFMWFGTANGLDKYDGYGFQVFQPDPNDPDHSLRHNIIWDILEDKSHQLWVATLGEGIHQVDKKTGQTKSYKAGGINRDLCYQICLDHQGEIWIASGSGLNQFNPVTKKFVLWPLPAPDDQEFRSVLEDSRGVLWAGTTKGLYQIDRRNHRYLPIRLDPNQPDRQDFINALYQDSAGVIWAFSINKGLYRFDYNESNQSYQLNRQVYLVGNSISPNGIAEVTPGVLWVGTHAQGIKQVNTHTGQETAFVQQRNVLGSLSTNAIYTVLETPNGIAWVGTENGINVSAPQARKFQVFQPAADPTFSRLFANNISTLCEDHEGIIWAGNNWWLTHTDGLFRFDRQRNTIRLYTHQPGQKTSLMSNHVTALLEDHLGILWVGTLDGLQSFNRTTGTFTQYPISIQVLSIQEDLAGNLWVGGHGGIARLARKTGKLMYCWQDQTNTANKLFRSRTGSIWVATSGRGLGRINPDSGTYAPVKVGRGNPLSHTPSRLSDWNILSIYEDKQGIVWLGTSQGGLNRFDPRSGDCSIITTRQGLPSNNIPGILSDDAGNLWLSTNRGLCRYNPIRGDCRNFDQRDGLQDEEFLPAYARSPQGELLFGGPNGFNVFRPGQLRDNPIPPIVYITGLQVFDQHRALPKAQLDLQHDENFLQLDFVGISYVLPEKNQYAYQLVGVDKDWVYNGTRRFARYTDLSPGTYTFRVKAANNDGVWTAKDASLSVVIHPPWWRTWWAYALYGLLIISAIWAFVTYRSRDLQRKNLLLERTVARRTEQVLQQTEEIKVQRDNLSQTLIELKATQNQLIQKEKLASLGELTAGIAHEIQNPLNFVNNFAEVSTELVSELREEEAKPNRDADLISILFNDLNRNLQKIQHHGSRASRIVKGMLEHSRTATGDVRPTNLNALADEYLKLAYHGQRAKDKTFTCELVTHFDSTIGQVNIMPQEIGRVLLNLFTNAFYAVRERQKTATSDYQPVVQIDTIKTPTGVEIRVSDNGMGIPGSVIDKIFQPFFTTKPTGEGTGLGLSLSYDIITQGHNGSIRVSSQENQGTEFIIGLPTA